jgi:hypothetical protein
MNWKKPVFLLGAVLLCTSLLMANTPPAQLTVADQQVKPLLPPRASPTQISALDSGPLGAMKRQAVLPKAPAVPRNLVGAMADAGARGRATITIEIFTDNYPSETTWEVVEWGGGVVASGGPYSDPGTLYTTEVEVNADSCYDFTIYDSYGDGICCAYGEGYYNVLYEGELFCTGGEFGSSETCTGIGGGCQWPSGACCVAQECVATNTEPECDDLGGTFYEGEDCFGDPPFECPASLVECPPGTLFGQNPHMPDDSWSFGNADVDANGSNYLRAESFSVDGDICDIHWWGIWAYLSGSWMPCDESDPTFEIKFYLDDGGAPGTEVCSYTVVPDQIMTGEVYADTFEMVYFSVELLNPCCIINEGWVSIQGFGDADCWFMWASSPDGDGSSYFNNNGTPEPYAYDLAVCLTGEYVERWGACCDDATGICEDNIEQQQCPPPLRFTADTLCAELDPPCGEIPGACCCPDGSCEITFQMNCYEPCIWMGDYTTCEDCPPLGACCVQEDPNGVYECVATCWEADCAGRWYEGEDCFGDPPFECPDTDADFIVQAPYTSEVLTTCDAGYDCDMVPDSPDHDWEVVIPYAATWNFNTCLHSDLDTMIFVGTTLCSQNIGSNDDSCGLQSEVIAYLEPGNYFCTIEHYCCDTCGEYVFDVHEVVPCVVECPEGGIPEAEPCGEDWNGGCNMTDPQFEPIECNTTICGTYWASGGTRDTDWYELVLTESMILTISLEGEQPSAFGLIEQIVLGVPGCDNITGYIDPYATPQECTPATVVTQCLPAGTYYVFAATQDFYDPPCDGNNDYVLTVECEPCVILGACCYGPDPFNPICEDLTEPECDALDGDWYFGESCEWFECPVPCEESQIDLAIMTDSYGYETSWEITDHNTGAVICSVPPNTYESNTLYNERCCIAYTDCVDFTMHDDYGDGIYAPGGFTLILDGEVIYDCMGSGWYGSVITIENFGGGCVEPVGACCTEALECVATCTEDECYTVHNGYRWYEDEDCFGEPPFVCPDTDADFLVEAPYTSPIRSTCGQGDDCNLVPTSPDHEYEVVIPNAGLWNFNTCLHSDLDTYIFVGTGLCTADIGENDDSCGLQSEVIVYLEPGNYFCTIEHYCCDTCGDYVFDVHEEVPCVVECPEDGIPEAEPCGDDTNGGCNMDVPQFEPIACMTTVCGTGWFDGGTRDTDWYEYIPVNDDTMTFAVEAEFDVLFGLIEQIVPGVPGCDNITGYVSPYALMPDCTPASVTFPVTAGGTFYVFVAPQFTDVFPCGEYSDYVATLTGEACICGDFDGDGDVDEDDFYFFLDAFGTCEGDEKYEEACDFDGDQCITLVDYQMWMQCYRDANGKGFIAPIKESSARRPAGQQGPQSPLQP